MRGGFEDPPDKPTSIVPSNVVKEPVAPKPRRGKADGQVNILQTVVLSFHVSAAAPKGDGGQTARRCVHKKSMVKPHG